MSNLERPCPVGFLTHEELSAIEVTADLVALLDDIVGDGATAQQDRAELVALVHSIQYRIMGQAAARAYPDRFRLLGETIE